MSLIKDKARHSLLATPLLKSHFSSFFPCAETVSVVWQYAPLAALAREQMHIVTSPPLE
jgi:hypothetical protein